MSKEARELVLLFVLASAIVTIAILGVYGGYLRNLTVFAAGIILIFSSFMSIASGRKPSNGGIKFGMTLGTALIVVSFCVGPLYVGSWVFS